MNKLTMMCMTVVLAGCSAAPIVAVGLSRGDRYLGHSSRHTQVPVPATSTSLKVCTWCQERCVIAQQSCPP